MKRSTATYYNYLSAWTAVARWFGYGGGHATQTVHRLLADPAAGGRPTATRLHDVLFEVLPPLPSPRVLDAGCGMGGTLIDFARRSTGGDFIGVTLSDAQADRGRLAISRNGLTDRVRIAVQSYDSPPSGPFDRIIAIESLAHSPAPARSLAALTAQLAPAGLLAVVDDLPLPGADADTLGDFKKGWQCPVLFTREQYLAAFSACGLELRTEVDLTASYAPRPLWRIALLERLNRLAHSLVPSPGWRMVLDSYHGGLALERLYRRQHIAYRLLVASRRDQPVAGERS